MTRRRAALAAACLAICALSPWGVAAQDVADSRARFSGTFVFVGGDRERAAVDVAIERAIESMNFIIRPIGRRRLRGKNAARASIAFRFPIGYIEVTFAGQSVVRSADTGAAASGRTIANEPYRVSQRFDGERLVQVLTTDDGARRNEFSLSADGRTLQLRVIVTSSQLPTPVNYVLTYRR